MNSSNSSAAVSTESPWCTDLLMSQNSLFWGTWILLPLEMDDRSTQYLNILAKCILLFNYIILEALIGNNQIKKGRRFPCSIPGWVLHMLHPRFLSNGVWKRFSKSSMWSIESWSFIYNQYVCLVGEFSQGAYRCYEIRTIFRVADWRE